ncbi:MAG: condensation domain-containing protein, partial [Planctomycetota bacterium]
MYPLSQTQQGFLFHTLLTPAAGIYVPQIVLELSGQIDSEILRCAWQVVIDRNAVLRTGFQWQQRDEPFQVVYREAELVWTEQNWTDAPVDEHQRMLDALLAANRTQPFDRHRPPLMRLNLIKRSGEKLTLVWCYHHLILDGWSAGLVMQQVMQAYGILKSSGTSSLTLLKSPPPYVDYIAWLQRQDQHAAKEFWTSRLSGKSSSSLAALHATTSSDQQAGFDEVTLSLNSSETSEIRGFLQDHGLTLNHLLQAAFGLLLSRYNHTREVTLGTTVSGRSSGLPDAMSMIGLFINTLPIRLSPNPGSTSVDWMHQIRDEQSAASDFEHVSLRDIQNWAGDGGPMFDCLFVLESYPLQVDQQQNSALNLDGIRFDEWTHLPLTLLVHEGDSLSVRAKYQRARLDGAAVKRMIDQAKRLLTNFVRKPTQPLGCFSLISETDRTTVSHWNETNQCWPESDQTLVDLLDRHRDSDHVAVVFDEASLTFSQLHQRADRIAIQLLKASVGADQPVAVLMRRCLDLPVALLAIVKAGAAFMPLDPEMPESRLQSILQDVQPSAIITNNTHLSFGIDELLASCGQTKIVDVAQAFPYQVQETDLGDFIPLAGPKAQMRGTQVNGKRLTYDPTSPTFHTAAGYTSAA